MEKVKFAIVGCGTIGDVHARAIGSLDSAKLVAVCDADKTRAGDYAKKYGVKAYSDYQTLLSDGDVDAVCICTPSGMHAEQAIAALKAGKHVLIEKPMALCEKDARAVCDEAAKSDKTVSVIFQTRYAEDINYLKEVIADGKLGALAFCDLYMKYWRDPSYYAASPWRGTFAMDGGGALMNQGIHGVDVMHYLLGAPRLLGARVKTRIHNIETEDTAAALVEYPCGAVGVIEASTSANPGFERRIEINGSRGYAVIIDAQLEKLVIDGETVVDKAVVAAAGTASDPTKMEHGRHALQISNFIGAIRGKEKLRSDANDGYLSVKFVEEVYKKSNEM